MQDPLADKAQDWTAYRYGFNNPMRFTDPTGMFEAGMMRAGKNASIQERSAGKDTQNMEGETDALDEGRNQNLQNSVLGFLDAQGTEGSNSNASRGGLQSMADAGDFSLSSNSNDSQGSLIKNIAKGAKVAAFGLSQSSSTFRLTNGLEGNFSPKIYISGWKGGSRARIKTFGLKGVGSKIGFAGGLITTGFAYNEIIYGKPQAITFVDAGVGTVGAAASASSLIFGYTIPFVGQAAGIYGILRTSYELGKSYGPSKWYGTNDNKWFE